MFGSGCGTSSGHSQPLVISFPAFQTCSSIGFPGQTCGSISCPTPGQTWGNINCPTPGQTWGSINCPTPGQTCGSISCPTFSSTSAPLGGNLFAPSMSSQSAFSWSNNASASTSTTNAPASVTTTAFPFPNAQSAFGSSTNPSPIFGNPVFTNTTQAIGTMKSSSSSSYPTFSSFENINPTKTPVFGCPGNPYFTSTTQASGSMNSSSLSSPTLSSFENINPTKSPVLGCNYIGRPVVISYSGLAIPIPAPTSSTPAPAPAPGFDFSSTPLPCFSRFPPTTSTSPSRTPPIFNNLTSPSGGQQLTPTIQVCPRCEHTSLWGSHWASRVAPYTPTPVPEQFDSNLRLHSILAVPIYEDRSHEELRWQDYQSQGKAQGCVTPACESSTSGQLLLALPVFVLPAMPTSSLNGFSVVPWTPSLGSTVGLCSSTHFRTTVPALSASPTLLGVPWTNAPVLGQPSFSASSTSQVMPAMFRRL